MDTENLYHYTSAPALLNILNTGYLRGTQAWHLSDGSECRHAIDTLREMSPALRQNSLWRSVEDTLLSVPRYVVCFSKARNDPHQWEHYGSSGTGACIVFDPQSAKASLLNAAWPETPCIYDQDAQRQSLEALVDEFGRRGEGAIEDRLVQLWEYNIAFKQEKFSPESEVRYFLSTPPKSEQAPPSLRNPEAKQLRDECSRELNSYAHPSGCFDERYRPYEPFCIHGAIAEIILGPRFTATRAYWTHLGNNYKVTQI